MQLWLRKSSHGALPGLPVGPRRRLPDLSARRSAGRPAGHKSEYFGPDARFGLLGSITTKEACDAASGEFHPYMFGWMVHVYPYESDSKKIWAVDDDDMGHDNMDHSAMPGMKMN